MSEIQLIRSAFGRLVFTDVEGKVHDGVVPVHAFPVTAPEGAIALVSPLGQELLWIDRMSDLPQEIRNLVEDELASREFMPEIHRLNHVSSFATPSVWQVETNRGQTSFVLKGEEDIRRLSSSTLLVADSHGIHFLIRDIQALDAASRKLLDRFL